MISAWLRGTDPRMVVSHTMPTPIGTTLGRGASTAVDVSSVNVVIQRDPHFATGYSIVTAYPTP
jgi:filamentous hemagglutinin